MVRPKLMQGNECCALGALAAGVRFFAGYPITPSTEIAEIFARELPKLGGVFMQMEDEIASLSAVIGASLTGKKALTATSGPGFSLMQENIGFAAIAEVPCVIVNVMRLGPSTGMPTMPAQGDIMQARWGTHGDHLVIALSPSSVKEVFCLTVRAVNLAERYRVPVILLIDEVIAHLREQVAFSPDEKVVQWERKQCTNNSQPFEETADGIPPFFSFGGEHRHHVTGLVHDESGFPTSQRKEISKLIRRLHYKISQHLAEIVQVEEFYADDAEVLIIAYGSTARSAQAAVVRAREKGKKAGLLRLITIWPFPEKEVSAAVLNKKAVIVPEMNMGQLALEVARVLPDKNLLFPVNRVDGELITPDEILEVIGRAF
ncbi:MAG: 2-oxoacid:acceptor oxidoreductase subunit alpha [Bacillota bacterium]|jgi:2-oxoglutarate ferredoxin oxidoreductase subunit alpha